MRLECVNEEYQHYFIVENNEMTKKRFNLFYRFLQKIKIFM